MYSSLQILVISFNCIVGADTISMCNYSCEVEIVSEVVGTDWKESDAERIEQMMSGAF